MSERKAPPATGSYAQTVVVGGLCFVSGQVPVDADGADVAYEDLDGQSRAVFENLRACLRGEGLEMSHVVSITTYLTDVADGPEVSRIRSEFFGEHRPTSTVVGVDALLKPSWRLEVQAIAVAHRHNEHTRGSQRAD